MPAPHLTVARRVLQPATGWWALACASALAVAVAVGAVPDRMSPLVAAGLLGVAACVWIGRPMALLIALLFFVAPIDISKAIVAPLDRFYSPGLYLAPSHLVVLGLLAAWGLHRMLCTGRDLPFTRLDGLALAFLAVIWLGALRSQQGLLAQASAVAYSFAVLAYYAASHVLDSPARLRIALAAAAAVVLLEAGWVALQLATGTPLTLPGQKGVALGAFLTFGGTGLAMRPTGFFVHPNALAHHTSLVIPPALALVLLGRQRLTARAWWGAAAVLVAASAMLLVSLSRGGWASVVLGALLVVVLFTRRGLLSHRHLMLGAAGSVLALMMAVAVNPSIALRLVAPDDRSTESRVLLTDQALTIIGEYPLMGVGFGDYNRAAHQHVSPSFGGISEDYQEQLLTLVVHNHYLLLAAELGIPAMLLFVVLLWRWVRLPWPLEQHQDPGRWALAVGLAGAMLSQVLFLSSDNYYADIRIFMIWLTAGLLQAVVRHGGTAGRVAK